MKSFFTTLSFLLISFSSFAFTTNLNVDKNRILDEKDTSINSSLYRHEDSVSLARTTNVALDSSKEYKKDTSLTKASMPNDKERKSSLCNKIVTTILATSIGVFCGYSAGIWIGSYASIGWVAGGVIGGVCGGLIGIIIANSIIHEREVHKSTQTSK